MTPNPVPKMTLDEYFEFDKASEGRFEYFDGMLFELSGVTREHAAIEINLSLSLTTKAREKGCEAFPASLRVKPPSLRTYRYPDFSIACGIPQFITTGGLDCLENPTLIVEILSESTEKIDRGGKFTEYKSIETFTEYLLISSMAVSVTLHQKHHGRFWLQSEYFAGETFHLNTLDIDLNVDDFYTSVDFITVIDD